MTNTRSQNGKAVAESVLDSMNEFVVVADEQLNIIYVNEVVCKAAGCEKGAFLSHSVTEVFYLPARTVNYLSVIDSCNVLPVTRFRSRFLANTTLSGIEVSVNLNRIKLQEDCGNAWCFTAHPFSAGADENKEVSDLDLQMVVENISDGLILDNEEGRIVYANNKFLEMFGLEKSDIDHIVIEDYVAPEFCHIIRERHEKRISGVDVETSFEFAGVRRDGVRRWMYAKVSPICTNGRVTGTQTTIRDITDQRLADENLLKAEREMQDYKYALDQSTIVAITNQQGIIQYVNDVFCKISGYSREELLGQDHRIVNSGYHPPAFIRNLWVTIANGGIWKGELRNRAKNGSFYWVDTT